MTTAQTLTTGTTVEAQNPGGLSVTGTLLGYTAEGFAEVEWFGPWMFNQRRRYVGRFTTVTAVAS